MKVNFIGHGFEGPLSVQAGAVLNEALASDDFNSFKAFSAFVSKTGVDNIKESIGAFCARGGNVELYVGVDLHGTSKEALQALIDAGIPTFIVHSLNSVVYHPKLYIFRGDAQGLIVLGSSNLTGSGLYQNIETSLVVKYGTAEEDGVLLEQRILSFFDGIISGRQGITNRLDEDLLTVLVNNGLVFDDEQNRQVRNAINRQAPATAIEDREKLKNRFNKVKSSRPPRGKKKTVSQENINVQPGTTATVEFESIVLPNGAMWIVSGQMTGGSRNILDLSKQGKRDGVVKFGSVEYFDVDKDDITLTYDVTLCYNGNLYEGNTIFYAPRNSNWRIRLNGETANGEKLTDVFRAVGSQNKVFIFDKTANPGVYNFHILEIDVIPDLEANSSDYAWGGKGGNGREYGIIELNP